MNSRATIADCFDVTDCRKTMLGVLALAIMSFVPACAAPPSATLTWEDRRPIARVFVSRSSWVSDTNPDGFLAKDVDTRTKPGIEAFRSRLLQAADKWIANARHYNAQGVVVWDIEGFQQASMVYVGDPRCLPEYAPAMDAVADDFFARFRQADLHVGITIRPIKVFRIPPESVAKWGKWGYRLYKDGEDDVLHELSDRIAYAHKRWGCTLFYIDSNFHKKNIDGKWVSKKMPAEMMAELRQRHPEVLLIPEHYVSGYEHSSAQYAELRMESTGTPAKVRNHAPRAFTVLHTGDVAPATLVAKWDSVVQSVRGGDVLFVDAWVRSRQNDFVSNMYRQAKYESQQIPAVKTATQDHLESLLHASEAADRFRAVQGSDESSTSVLLDLLHNDPDWVVRLAACRALGRIGTPEAVGGLEKIISHPHESSLRYFAIDAAVRGDARAAAQVLSRLAGHDLDALRKAAAFGLGRLSDGGAETLITLLEDPKSMVRLEAARALVSRPTPEAANALIRRLAVERSLAVQEQLIFALGKTGSAHGIDAIAPYQKAQIKPKYMQQRIRSAAQKALAELKSAR